MTPSRAQEIAEREAAEAEAETPDVDNGDNGDPDAEPGTGRPDEPERELPELQGASDKDVDKALKALEREAERHAKRVAEIMGPGFADVSPCPLCWQPGFVLDGWGATLEEPQKDAVRAAIGDAVPEPLRMAKGYHECGECAGHGKLRYPGKNPHMATQTCLACNGNGYVSDAAPPQPPAPVFTFPSPQSYAPTTANGPGALDRWGRPQGHVHYGQDPAHVGA